jgi:uncharacterized protein (DUF4415 family)
MTDKDIRDAIDSDPDTEEFGDWRNVELEMPSAKQSVHLRVDPEVLAWFRAQGPGHLTRMNAVLRSYYKAHRR